MEGEAGGLPDSVILRCMWTEGDVLLQRVWGGERGMEVLWWEVLWWEERGAEVTSDHQVTRFDLATDIDREQCLSTNRRQKQEIQQDPQSLFWRQI